MWLGGKIDGAIFSRGCVNESWTDGGMTDGDGDDAFVSVSACAIHIVW
jgi:hypothetical protein